LYSPSQVLNDTQWGVNLRQLRETLWPDGMWPETSIEASPLYFFHNGHLLAHLPLAEHRLRLAVHSFSVETLFLAPRNVERVEERLIMGKLGGAIVAD